MHIKRCVRFFFCSVYDGMHISENMRRTQPNSNWILQFISVFAMHSKLHSIRKMYMLDDELAKITGRNCINCNIDLMVCGFNKIKFNEYLNSSNFSVIQCNNIFFPAFKWIPIIITVISRFRLNRNSIFFFCGCFKVQGIFLWVIVTVLDVAIQLRIRKLLFVLLLVGTWIIVV